MSALSPTLPTASFDGLSLQEERILDAVASRRDELTQLLCDLVNFNTTTRVSMDDPAREEAALQHYLASRLTVAGAATEVWEPAPEGVAGSRLTPPGLRFDGRPQMAARFAGSGNGRSLLFNGHIDVVTPEPLDRWASDPFKADIRDGMVYGRGACDMKGGIASMVFAAETLASLGLQLAGDLVVCTVTDEESTGAGALAAVAHGVKADAGIVTESTNFEIEIACRGSLIPTFTVPGRSGHAGCPQAHWHRGGAVNAIDKALVVQDAMRRLQEDWWQRTYEHHPMLLPGEIVAVEVAGGEWIVSYPSSCRLVYHITYLPTQRDAEGWGGRVKDEVVDWVARACAADPWLAENPPIIEWAPEVPAVEVAQDEPIIAVLRGASTSAGRPPRVSGMDGWFDGATFSLGGTPSIAFGPGVGSEYAHIVDERIAIDDLVTAAQALALTAYRFCGAAA